MKKVSPYKTGLDKGNAYWMAKLAKEVYLKKSEDVQIPDEKKILENLQKDDPKFISVFGVDNNSAQGALIEHEEYLCIAFRGTNESLDWIDNVNALGTKKLFGEFHRGFWNSVEDIWEPLNNRLINLQKQRKLPVFITGHSLGGAMATIAAAKFIQEDKPFTSVYTFGQPRAMKRDTAVFFNAEAKTRYHRFHNNNDIVTRVPARFMGYSHIGNYLYISEEGKICQEPGYWFRFLDHIDGALSALKEKGIDGVADHSMDKYLEFIDNWKIES